jgi:hypothetical protein
MMELLRQYNDKGIYFLSGDIRQLWADIETLHPHFVCAIFLFQQKWLEEDLKRLIERLISHGAAYFAFHGNRCERAHDIADEVQSRLMPGSEMTYDNVIGTTWYSDEQEDEVIFSAFCASVPADEYLETFSSYVIISMGTKLENDRIRELLNNLEFTIDMVTRQLDRAH